MCYPYVIYNMRNVFSMLVVFLISCQSNVPENWPVNSGGRPDLDEYRIQLEDKIGPSGSETEIPFCQNMIFVNSVINVSIIFTDEGIYYEDKIQSLQEIKLSLSNEKMKKLAEPNVSSDRIMVVITQEHYIDRQEVIDFLVLLKELEIQHFEDSDGSFTMHTVHNKV